MNTFGDRRSPNFAGVYFRPRSEAKLQRQLANSRILSPGDLAERWLLIAGRNSSAEADSTRRNELRVIEDVKQLRPEFEIDPFRDWRGFVECHVPVVNSGPMEESPIGPPKAVPSSE